MTNGETDEETTPIGDSTSAADPLTSGTTSSATTSPSEDPTTGGARDTEPNETTSSTTAESMTAESGAEEDGTDTLPDVPPVAACGNGIIDPGELCLDPIVELNEEIIGSHTRLTRINDDDIDDVFFSSQQGSSALILPIEDTLDLQETQFVFPPSLRGDDMGFVNGDERADQVFATNEGIFIAYADPAFGFEDPVTISTHSECRGIEVADVDGDGDDDVLCGDGTQTLRLLRSNGDEYFTPETIELPEEPLPSHPYITHTMIVAHLDGDQHADLYVSRQGILPGDTFQICRGNGDGTFSQCATTSEDLTKVSSFVDVDDDGNLDMVVCGADNRHIEFRVGNGDRTFGDVHRIDVTGDESNESSPTWCTLADINADGILDLGVTVGSYEQSFIEVYLGPVLEAAPPATIHHDVETQGPGPIIFHDLDGDDAIDLFYQVSSRLNVQFANP